MLHFELVTPEKLVRSEDVYMVVVPGTEGDFGVLEGHEPFMTTLRPGAVTVTNGAAKRVFEIQGGFADVTPESFTLLAEHATEATVQ